MRDQRFRHHTKKGPGRYHGGGRMFVVRPLLTDIRLVKRPEQRLRPAIEGGNWKGLEYLTYCEHDRIKRFCMHARTLGTPVSYAAARGHFLEERRNRPAPRVIEQEALA